MRPNCRPSSNSGCSPSPNDGCHWETPNKDQTINLIITIPFWSSGPSKSVNWILYRAEVLRNLCEVFLNNGNPSDCGLLMFMGCFSGPGEFQSNFYEQVVDKERGKNGGTEERKRVTKRCGKGGR